MPLLTKQDAVLDENWRLFIPAIFRPDFGQSLNSTRVLFLSGNGCVRIYPYPDGEDIWLEQFRVSLRKKSKNGNGSRMSIPGMFRRSVSFFYGRTVTLVGKREYIEIQPSPPWKEATRRGRPSKIMYE